MALKLRWLAGLAATAVMAGYVARAPREPFADRTCEVEAVTVLDPHPTVYKLDAPFRVIRDGRVTFSRPEEAAPLPVLRVDLTIDGEPVTVYTRRRE